MSHKEAQKAQRIDIDQEELEAVMRREKEELERTWARPTGLLGWFTDTDHKAIAKRYIVTAFIFFIFGGIEAALMRIQLMRPDNHFLSPDKYNQIFTVHGTTMMFLFAVPVMQGLGIYLLPLMVGARAIAFPRLVAFSYWMFLFGGIFLYAWSIPVEPVNRGVGCHAFGFLAHEIARSGPFIKLLREKSMTVLLRETFLCRTQILRAKQSPAACALTGRGVSPTGAQR